MNDQLNSEKYLRAESIEQKSLSIAIDKRVAARRVELISSLADPAVRNLHFDRLLSIRTPESYGWLTAVPNANLGLFSPNEMLQIQLQIRMGHLDTSFEYKCPGRSAHVAEREASGLEVLKCKACQKERHDALASVFANLARSAGEHPRREPLNVLRDGSQKKPGDVVLPRLDRGNTAALDFNVTNNKQGTFVSSKPVIAGRAAKFGEARKNAKWRQACASAGATFVPMCVDVYGYWTETARVTIFELAQRRKDYTGRDPQIEYKYMMQLLATTLQRENARIIANHRVHPNPPAIDEDDHLEPTLLADRLQMLAIE